MATKKQPPAKAPVKKAPAKNAVQKPERGSKRPEFFDVSSILNSTIDDIAKRQGFESSSLETIPPMSTGVLSHDLIMGGGIRPAWFTMFGMEQSAKTTSALTIMASAVKEKIPLIPFLDYEGSTASSLDYVKSILNSVGLKVGTDEVFGKKDKDGKWVIPPLVRYRSETVLESFFDFMHAVLAELPDKRLVAGQWWLVFDDTKVNKAKIGDAAEPAMAKKYGKGLWVKAADGKLQAIFFVDSYPAMNPRAQDKEDTNNSLALQARSFSQQIPRVKGRMAQKMVAVVGINQLRAVPMAMYGPTENEPGGNALKLYSDCRIKHTSRALSAAPFTPKQGAKVRDEQEPSATVEGGLDTYRYVMCKAIKNKLAIPQREAFIRIWAEDATGTARGLDPVFDTVFYLKETGQITGKRAKFVLNLDGLGAAKKPVTWMVLKKWILGDKETMTSISTQLGYKPMSLRAFCFKQMRDGVAEELYVKTKGSKSKASEDDAEEE
jgi:RecA/RadA recombinase